MPRVVVGVSGTPGSERGSRSSCNTARSDDLLVVGTGSRTPLRRLPLSARELAP
ncbi:hypothetical protein M8Z33_25935 [Streptomyces sp. ZAF1911]|uniref:hypothetical protein n=1 Tax=unclassified Streptomyces TaxID=2593676 RepID=UPI00237B02CD|nr:hypothetical protein [Streptomyces sp. ZAF1911]MDD9380035.1 hypothetical protein [Streptomyces sp. ZAF1911]